VLGIVAGLGRRIGLEIIPSWRLTNRELALHLQEVFDVYGVDAVLDVGANEGQFQSLLRADVGFTGRIVSFEPVAELGKKLNADALNDEAWTIHTCALGSFDGEQPLNVTHALVMSSFLQPRVEAPHPRIAELSVVVRQENVSVRRLDTLWPQLWNGREPRRPFLKIDTQGWDLEVLEGATGVLASVPALLTELSVLPIYTDQPGYRVMLDRIQALGFALSGIFPVVRDRGCRLIEMDCVFVNERLASEEASRPVNSE
jgi:FkbM family methyltransferase